MAYPDNDIFKQGPVAHKTITIANGATDSDVLDTEAYTFFALLFPAAFTGVTCTFKASHDNSTFKAIEDDGSTAVSITVTTDTWVGLQSAVMTKLAAFRYLKLVSASAEGAARTIQVVLK